MTPLSLKERMIEARNKAHSASVKVAADNAQKAEEFRQQQFDEESGYNSAMTNLVDLVYESVDLNELAMYDDLLVRLEAARNSALGINQSKTRKPSAARQTGSRGPVDTRKIKVDGKIVNRTQAANIALAAMGQSPWKSIDWPRDGADLMAKANLVWSYAE